MSGRDYQVSVCKQLDGGGEKQQGEVKNGTCVEARRLGFDFGNHLTVLSLSLLICVPRAC